MHPELLSVYHGLAYKAQRRALIPPILGHACTLEPLEALKQVRRRWLKRVSPLADLLSCVPPEHPDNLQFQRLLGNCAVATVQYASRFPFFCRLSRICPFCYCRTVVLPLFTTLRAYLKHCRSHPESPAPHLVVFRQAEYVRRELDYPEHLWWEFKPHVKNATQSQYPRGSLLGGWRHAIMSQDRHHPRQWQFSRREVLIVHPSAATQAPRGLWTAHPRSFWSVRVPLENLPVRRLAALIGAVCRYPAGLLVGPLDSALTAFQVMRCSRTFQSYGCLYNFSEDEL